MKKSNENILESVVKLVEKNGLTYAQYQQLETLGRAKIKGDKLLIKGKDY